MTDRRAGGSAALPGELATELLEDAPCGLAVTDPAGNLLLVNRTLAAWVRRSQAELTRSCRLKDLLTPPGRIYFETHLVPMIRLQGHVREIACQLARPEEAPLQVLLSGVARRDRAGDLLRIDYTIFDATERALYEKSLREARSEAEQLAAIVRTSPNAILRVDSDGRVLRWNRAAEKLFGIAAADATGRPVEDLIRLRDRPHWFADCVDGSGAADRHRFEASVDDRLDLDITISRIGEPGAPAARPDYSIILSDVSDKAKAERRLRTIVGELNHRVKNVLSLAISIARQTLEGEARDKFTRRMHALGRAHDVLTSTNWGAVRLHDLVALTAEETGGPGRFQFEGPELLLSPTQATTLSMVLHELTTNALKYGALSAEGGMVAVRWELQPGAPERRLHFRWQEKGGPKVRPPSRQGFGTRMIARALAFEFAGEVAFDYPPEGLTCRICFPYTAPERSRQTAGGETG